jgi:hypothetical protein
MLVSWVVALCLWQCPSEVDQTPTTPGGLTGTSVAIDGDLAVIGAPIGTGNDWATGMAIVYRNIDNVWVREAELVAHDGQVGDMMGVSVDVSGNRVIAGAWFENHAGTNSGAAYIFQYIGDEWIQTDKLVASDGAAQDSFGRRCAIDGDICVVTAPLDDDNGSSSGSAYVFQFDGTWFQLQKLTAKTGTGDDQFGLGLAMDGERIVIGAPWANNGQGRAHVFDRGDVMFFETAVLEDPAGASMDNFSFGMDVDGNTVAIGSYLDDDVGEDSGSVFMFSDSPIGWNIIQQLTPQGKTKAGDQFGVSIAIRDSVMMVGNRFGDLSNDPVGSVTVHESVDDVWNQKSSLYSSLPESEAEFGWSVAMHGDNAVVGGPWLEPDGDVMFFEGLSSGCGCVADITGDSVVNVSDLLTILGVWGSCEACEADINEDGFVNVTDLLVVIGEWGPCPD